MRQRETELSLFRFLAELFLWRLYTSPQQRRGRGSTCTPQDDARVMMITDTFVFVHQPKTGGHFVRDALYEATRRENAHVLRRVARRCKLANSRFVTESEPYHATCRDIPDQHRAKPILSVVRNPFEFYVSQYHYGWWAAYPEESFLNTDAVRASFPSFPDLSFDQFLICLNSFDKYFERLNPQRSGRADELGVCSAQFIHFYFKEPRKIYGLLDLNGPLHTWTSKMFDVQFLRTQSLNDDLYNFLISMGYGRRNISFIKDKPPVIPADRKTIGTRARDYMSYYSQSARDLVLNKDALLFKMFPEFLVGLKQPISTTRSLVAATIGPTQLALSR